MGAPLTPVANVLKVVAKGFIDNVKNEVWANVLHFAFGGTGPTNATAAAIASAIASQWGTHMSPEQPAPTTLEEVQVTDLSSTTAGEGTWSGSIAGTRGDDSIPANAALLISYPVQVRYKGGHPRSYLYVLGNADFTGAEAWTAAATAEVLTHWNAFLTGCLGVGTGGTTLNGLVAIRYHGKFLPNSGPPFYYLTTPIVMPLNLSLMTADSQIASQRRRIGREEGGAPEVFKGSRRIAVNQLNALNP